MRRDGGARGSKSSACLWRLHRDGLWFAILSEKVRVGSTRSPTTLLREQATAHTIPVGATAPTIPVGATALRVVLARWPAQTQQCGLRVWRPLHVHLACWSRPTISQRLAT
ncbi:hypothetical protein [Dictyobacter vulcani]|uniref:hypothetical protein n=1 Tax=Dictyobacter vulcani TaxID=2607529 RepID=UPI0013868C8D|nr:hypothetical protein [Dictyobacter vulcani]